MKFKSYITESINDPVEISYLIKRDCEPYLKQLNGSNFSGYSLLRSGRQDSGYFKKVSVRVDRKPKDTPIDIHNWLDEWFYKKFGIKARSNTMFCTSSISLAGRYGSAIYYIFPMGNFEIIWSDIVNDMYTPVMNRGLDAYITYFLDHYGKKYKKGDLQGALKSKSEIMLHCKEYYILDDDGYNTEIILKAISESI